MEAVIAIMDSLSGLMGLEALKEIQILRFLEKIGAPTIPIVNAGKGPFTYYVSSYNKAGSVRMLTNADLRDQGFIENLMSYENP